ncbi:putative enzyme related to lactoylglutathione lyase [Methanohalophilus levihalophilus]|uniref:VOC family protein n=1 Tax=Methanohalophilus levihalophilus TaxID=1431282 RepID=UPI001AE5E176|nr:VOC family protein [Methanohalophilus levihalophilus]MBP2029091.1 putative enzyme related to lactoylglutathione lyase [Methanohalophilus levihalophilus]
MPTITHLDIPADDVERATKFYSDVFGWKIEKVPGPMDYYIFETTDNEGNPGVGGGIGERSMPDMHTTSFVDVPSIDEYIAKVEDNGGKIIMPKAPVPGMGYMAVFLDTEENPVGLWETDETATE